MSLKKYLTEAELAAVQPVTGDEFDISIRDITNIETFVLEHTEGSITIALDETAIQMLEHCGCTFEEDNDEEQIDELAPVIGAVGGALARGAGALAKGAAKAAVGTGIKAAADKLDKKIFGPKPNEGDYEYEEGLNDIRRLSGMKIDELSNAAKQAYVKGVKDKGNWFSRPNPGSLAGMQQDMDTVSDYAKKDPSKTTLSADWDKIHKNLKSKYDRRALNVNKVQGQLAKAQVGESEYDTSPNSPYDRGAADAYYGRAARPHKIVPYTGADGVKGQMQKVPLTDPSEIAAYEAGYREAEFGEKDYGESVMPEGRFEELLTTWRIVSKKNDSVVVSPKFNSKEEAQKYLMTKMFANHQDYKVVNFGSSVMPEGIEDWNMGVTSIPRTEPFKLKNIVVKSPGGKTYTFDTEEDARRLFLDKWNVVKDPSSGWTVNMNNTKAELEEGPFTGVGKWSMKKKLNKEITKHLDNADDALNKNAVPSEPMNSNWDVKGFEHEKGQANRKEKALKRLSRESVEIATQLMIENKLTDFLPPFTANGLWVSDSKGNSVLEVTRHGAVAQEVADALNKYATKSTNEGEEERKQNRLWLQIDDYEKRAKATKNDIKKHHYNKMAQELRGKLKTNDEPVSEAEYQGRKVQLGKPMQGDVKKFKVYVKDPKTGNVKKVNFGDPNMRIKKSNPARRKSFRARHNCDNPGPRTKARYWSCRKW